MSKVTFTLFSVVAAAVALSILLKISKIIIVLTIIFAICALIYSFTDTAYESDDDDTDLD